MMRSRHQSGATIVEVLVAIALTGILLPALAMALVTAHAGKATVQQQLQAQSLLREATEAVRSVRESGWSNIATNGTYHPVISGSGWTLASGSETIGNFTRSVVIADTERDNSGAIVTSGTVDPATKHVTVLIAWSAPSSGSESSDSYLTRWAGNAAWSQTTQADFTAGTLTGTTVTNIAGGEVTLGGSAPYSSGIFESTTFDAGSEVSFNRIDWNGSTPGDANIKFQIAVNNTGSGWSYVGPDGTNATYYTAGAPIALSTTTGQYLRFKAYLDPTSDSLQTPTLDEVQVNCSL